MRTSVSAPENISWARIFSSCCRFACVCCRSRSRSRRATSAAVSSGTCTSMMPCNGGTVEHLDPKGVLQGWWAGRGRGGGARVGTSQLLKALQGRISPRAAMRGNK